MQILSGPAFTRRGRGLLEACALEHPANAGTARAVPFGPAMASSPSLAGVLGLLFASALPGVLGDGPNPDLRAHPGTSQGCWREAGTARGSQAPAFPPLLSSGDQAQIGPGAVEPRRRPPPKDQRERAGAPALPLGALYTAAVVAFVLYKCLQVRDDQGWGFRGPESPLGTLWYQDQDTSSHQSIK